MAAWLMTASLPILFAAGVIIGIPIWLLILRAFGTETYESPYAHAQQRYEIARDRYQKELAARLAPSTSRKEGALNARKITAGVD
jgi:hypothetical protein